MGFSPWPGHQALEMLQGGCRLLLPAGLRSPETHVQRPPGAQWSPRGREPRADAQGIRKETDSSPAPECGFPHHSPLQGHLCLPHHCPARLPGNKPPGPSCLLGAPGSLGTVSSWSCHHLQAFGGVDWGQSSHSDESRCSYKRVPTAHGTLSGWCPFSAPEVPPLHVVPNPGPQRGCGLLLPSSWLISRRADGRRGWM